jgi:OOP family OmpA-OmpF porin
MRHATKLLMIVVLTTLSFAQRSNAQSEKRPWLINAGVNAIDFNAAYNFDEIGKTENWNVVPAISKISLARNLNSSLALDLQLGGSRITTTTDGNTIGARGFFDADIDLRYKFDNGYIINENAFFAPYIFVGGGMNYLAQDQVRGNVGGGLGFNLWFWKDFGAFIQSCYRFVPGEDEEVAGKQSYLNHSAGIVVRFGKKDTDKDGIEDDEDACPTEAGPASTMGCPDRDNDGVADKTDACPDQPGLATLQGCPDTDGDGIADKDDRCPSEAGAKELQGCPDRDGDAVADIDDACPDQKGSVAMKGCPDSDGDGVADKDDACPTQKGLAKFQGCPDADGDNVPDNKDKCPNQAGPPENAGCPVPKPEEIQKINLSAKSIQFQTGKDIITKQSFAVLDIIAEIMQQYPQTKWEIDGHTDNTGKPDKNMDLSNRRAAAVKQYFLSKGVSSDRLDSTGFGDTKPIADNKTSAGRAQNRRVEIKLLSQQ